MTYYLIAFICFMSATLFDVNSKGPLNRPLNDMPLKVAGNLGTLGALALIILGIVFYKWWYPLAGFGASMIASHILCFITQRVMPFVLAAILLDIVGVGFAVITILNR
jgi:hypothetical protein